ncbi:Gfo/Idh/MocA family oxidoreductase [Actinospica sp.]|uniref:Gfo/Idh/MocA family protein n=1 Tax=Actinospica sp. TaxID=1872142 RepID=UPI002BC1FDC2|nr:Gfo/Idh/MocA family oxidoreductase [Actinospica sp.]HWG23036.1 Gfo/Idh/MocA family oxidoreductase [Actinospica sp.]
MQPLRIAIAGTGMIGAVHADAARRAGARVLGVSASTAERAKAASARLGAERSFDSSEELAAADDVDVVHICTPNDLHGPLVRLALAAGKHVICEKPLSVDAADADALVELAEDSGLINAVPFVYRYHPMAAEARHRVRSGAIGPVRLLHGHYLQDWLMRQSDDNWRVDAVAGGASRAFADIGSHWCDLVEWVTGHRISELSAVTQTVHPERARSGSVATEDVVHVVFRTDLGATGSLVVSQVSPGRKNRLWFEVDGAEHSVSFDQENPETLLFGGRERTESVVRDPGTLSAEAARLSPVPAGHPLGYRDCFAGFVADVYDAVRTAAAGEAVSESALYPTFADAARTARITDAVLRSAHSRTWIEVL